ncbi:MAG: hypothetical protein J0L84_05370 [Verrucomicrobia bacterium]|nr:hypothetical protein [Verrucomicrobiota bacterium]
MQDLSSPSPGIHRLSVDACVRAAAFALRSVSRNDLEQGASPPDAAAGPMAVPSDAVPDAAVAVACRWLEAQGTETVHGAMRDAVAAASQDLVCSGAVPEAGAAWRETPGGWEPCDVQDGLEEPPEGAEAPGRLRIPQLPSEALAETTVAVPVSQGPFRTLIVVIGVWDEGAPRMGRRFRDPGDAVLLLRPAPTTNGSAATLYTTMLGLIAEGVVRSACGRAGRGIEGALAEGGRPASRGPEPEAVASEPGSGDATPWATGPDAVLITAASADVGRLLRQAGILGVEARVIARVDADPASSDLSNVPAS